MARADERMVWLEFLVAAIVPTGGKGDGFIIDNSGFRVKAGERFRVYGALADQLVSDGWAKVVEPNEFR